jgi:hypothetical protein
MTDDIYCPDCGQNLRGTVSDRCPECGASITDLRSTESRIPWSHRATRGRVRSYLRTVYMVLFKTRRFCAEISRPVSYADAQSFRWATVLLAWMPFATVAVALHVLEPKLLAEAGLGLPSVRTQVWLLASVVAAWLLWLIGATGVTSYCFHPAKAPVRLQNRGIALSYYATAPLCMIWLAAASMAWSVLGAAPFNRMSWIAAGQIVIVILLTTWLVVIGSIARHSHVGRPHSAFLLRVLVVAFWLIIASVTLIALPMATVGVLILVDSLN